MIQVTRNDNEVEMKVTLFIPYYDSRIFTFSWRCSSKEYAGLLADRLNQKLGDAVQAARAEAYEQGWRDAKAHNTKETWFSPTI